MKASRIVVTAGVCAVALAIVALAAHIAIPIEALGLCRVPPATAIAAALVGAALVAVARRWTLAPAVLACGAVVCAFADVGQYVLAIGIPMSSVQDTVYSCSGKTEIYFASTPIAVVLAGFALLLLPMLPAGTALCAAVIVAVAVAQQVLWLPDLTALAAPRPPARTPVAASLLALALGAGLMGASRLRDREGRIPAWVSLAAPAILLAGGVLFWQALVRTQIAGVTRMAAHAASAVRTDVIEAVAGLGSVLALLARLPPDPERAWDEEAEVLQRTSPGVLALEVIAETGEVRRRIVLADEGASAVPLMGHDVAVLARAAASREALVTTVRTGPDGRPLVRLLLHRRGDGARRGFVSAVVDLQTMIEAATAEVLLEWGIRVETGGQPVFAGGRGVAEGAGEPFAARREVVFPDGTAWQVVVMPSATLWGVTRTGLPQVVLVGTLIVAVLLAAAARLARTSSVQAGRLAREVEQRRRAEQELRALTEGLERRVAERTEELSRVNVTLRSENARRQQAEWRLRRSNEDLRQFAAFVSHELRQPLSTIGIWTELLEGTGGEALDEEQRLHLAKIRGAVARMTRLIQGELALAQVTQGDAPKETVDLGTMLEELRGDLAPAIESAGARLETGPLGVVEADPEQLRLVFRNLVENALKYRRPGAAPVIRIEERPGPHPGICEVVVSDNGRGFADADAGEIFSMFRRSADGDVQGSGVGLAVCRRIVERHGGTIVAEGRPGEGATFRVRLPRTAADVDAALEDAPPG